MTDLYFYTDCHQSFVLAYMCVLVNLSETLNPKQAKGFLLTFVLIGGISILEILSVLVDDGSIWLRPINIISNYLGFGLTPAVSLCLVLCDGQFRTYKTVAQSCNVHLIVYFLILTVSLFSGGLVFSVDSANHYSENGFCIYMLMHYAGIVYLFLNTLEMARNFQNRGRELIYGLAGFLAVGTMVQILIPSVHITWLCVTLIAVLLFLYCNEMWNQLDGLTGFIKPEKLY